MKWHTTWLLLLITATCWGCGETTEPDEAAALPEETTTAAKPAADVQPKVAGPVAGGSPVIPPPPPLGGAPFVPPPPPASGLVAATPEAATPATDDGQKFDGDYELVQAVVGVGKQGRYESNDYISTVVSARFRAAQTIEFAKIPRAMQMYKAESRGQRGPKSHEEFMKEIIEANLIRLPELPDGEEYRYVPKDDTLYVARPKN